MQQIFDRIALLIKISRFYLLTLVAVSVCLLASWSQEAGTQIRYKRMTSPNRELNFEIPDCWIIKENKRYISLYRAEINCTGFEPTSVTLTIAQRNDNNRIQPGSKILKARQGETVAPDCAKAALNPGTAPDGQRIHISCSTILYGTDLSLKFSCGDKVVWVSTLIKDNFDPAKNWTIEDIKPAWLKYVFSSFECARSSNLFKSTN